MPPLRSLLLPIAGSMLLALDAFATPQDDAGAIAVASRLLTSGKVDEATQRFDAILAAHPDDAAARLGLAKCQRQNGQPDDAVATLLEAIKVAPNDFDVTLELARALVDQAAARKAENNGGDQEMAEQDALRMFDEAAALKPTVAAPLVEKSRFQRGRGEKDAALATSERAIEIEPKNVDALLEHAVALYTVKFASVPANDSDASRAVRKEVDAAYQRVLQVDPKNGWALNGLGWTAKVVKDNDQAVKRFHESLLADATIEDSYSNLDQLLATGAADRKRLVDLLDRVVDSVKGGDEIAKRTRALALYHRGIVRGTAGQFEGLRKDFAECVRLASDFRSGCRYEEALALFRDGQHDKATAMFAELEANDSPRFRALIEADPKRRSLRQILSLVSEEVAKDTPEAMACARELARVCAEEFDVVSPWADQWNNYAFLCRETGQYEQAYAAYERAIELAPNNPSFLNDTALILQYHLNRDLDHAADLYQRAIDEGKRVLDDNEADSAAKDAASTAVRDATNNLRMLKSGEKPVDPAGRARAGG